MPFEPGHAYHPPAHPDRGRHAIRKAAARSLAAEIRERVSPDEVVTWLKALWLGRDPATQESVDLDTRFAALRLLLERGWGAAPQHVVVEASLTATVAQVGPAPDAFDQLTEEQLQALERLGIEPGSLVEGVDDGGEGA